MSGSSFGRKFLFFIEGPPPVQRRMRGKRHYKPKKNEEDEERVRESFRGNYPNFLRSERKFSVELKIYTRKTCDGDNVEKAVLDALTKVLWEDDRQVRQVFWVFMDQSPLHKEGVQVLAVEF